MSVDSVEYNADCIKITDGSQFDWAVEGSIAAHYGKRVEFIRRGQLACKLASVPFNYFVQRYLEMDKTVEREPNVELIYSELLKDERD